MNLRSEQDFFHNILDWAKHDDRVAGLILVGSRAAEAPPDELADYDLQVYSPDPRWLQEDDSWWQSIAPVWVCIPTYYEHSPQLRTHTRLVIYAGGVKVDFSIFPLSAYPETRLQPARVLLDKSGFTEGANSGAARLDDVPPPRPPSAADIQHSVDTFWFEAYHVAKYLHRRELWMAKFRDWSCKVQLLQMLEWQAQSRHNWQLDTHYLGKHMARWADHEAYRALFASFGRFDPVEAWPALFVMMGVFRASAQEVAAALGLAYNAELDANINAFCHALNRR